MTRNLTPSCTVYVGNLSKDTTESQLRSFFSVCGNICEVEIAKRSDNKTKGFGYVKYSTIAEAQKAIQVKNECRFNGKFISVQFAIATDEERRNSLKKINEQRKLKHHHHKSHSHHSHHSKKEDSSESDSGSNDPSYSDQESSESTEDNSYSSDSPDVSIKKRKKPERHHRHVSRNNSHSHNNKK